MQYLRDTLKNNLIFYSELMPHEVHGELLNVRQALDEAILSIMLWEPYLFITGQNHSNQHRLIGESIQNYTIKVDDFTRVLGEWN